LLSRINGIPEILGHPYSDESVRCGADIAKFKDEALDRTVPKRFGFRELWIEGRDFFLNGTRIFLSAVPVDNAQVGAAWSTYAAARESLERLKNIGVNFVYTHNYDCEPGGRI
jgi:beta-galactosidase/beta-glucuronidase